MARTWHGHGANMARQLLQNSYMYARVLVLYVCPVLRYIGSILRYPATMPTRLHMYARALAPSMPSVMGGIRPYAPHQLLPANNAVRIKLRWKNRCKHCRNFCRRLKGAPASVHNDGIHLLASAWVVEGGRLEPYSVASDTLWYVGIRIRIRLRPAQPPNRTADAYGRSVWSHQMKTTTVPLQTGAVGPPRRSVAWSILQALSCVRSNDVF
jgi:hypothetical protein